MLAGLHEDHPGLFTLKILALQNVWWPKIKCEIQVHKEKRLKSVKDGKNLKTLMAASEFLKLTTVVESNEGIELDFALPLSIIWEQKITTRVYRSLLKTFISPNYL